MATTGQVADLTSSGESETLEFKETTGTRRQATMTVCAFLNGSGGRVLFGVTDAGAVVGQQVGERTAEELSAELRRINPPAFPTVERVPEDVGAVTVRFRHGLFIPRPITSDPSGPEDRRELILALLEGVEEGLTRREIYARLGPDVSERQVRTTLEELRDGGLVVSTARGPLTRWRRVEGAR